MNQCYRLQRLYDTLFGLFNSFVFVSSPSHKTKYKYLHLLKTVRVVQCSSLEIIRSKTQKKKIWRCYALTYYLTYIQRHLCFSQTYDIRKHNMLICKHFMLNCKHIICQKFYPNILCLDAKQLFNIYFSACIVSSFNNYKCGGDLRTELSHNYRVRRCYFFKIVRRWAVEPTSIYCFVFAKIVCFC